MRDLETLYHVNLDAASEAARVGKKLLVATTEDATEAHRVLFWHHVPFYPSFPDGMKASVRIQSGSAFDLTPVPGVGYAFVQTGEAHHWWLIAERER